MTGSALDHSEIDAYMAPGPGTEQGRGKEL